MVLHYKNKNTVFPKAVTYNGYVDIIFINNATKYAFAIKNLMEVWTNEVWREYEIEFPADAPYGEYTYVIAPPTVHEWVFKNEILDSTNGDGVLKDMMLETGLLIFVDEEGKIEPEYRERDKKPKDFNYIYRKRKRYEEKDIPFDAEGNPMPLDAVVVATYTTVDGADPKMTEAGATSIHMHFPDAKEGDMLQLCYTNSWFHNGKLYTTASRYPVGISIDYSLNIKDIVVMDGVTSDPNHPIDLFGNVAVETITLPESFRFYDIVNKHTFMDCWNLKTVKCYSHDLLNVDILHPDSYPNDVVFYKRPELTYGREYDFLRDKGWEFIDIDE